MSDESKPERQGEWPHTEKQTMKEPVEEFIDDEARPSRDVNSGEKEPDPVDVKPAGHQEKPPGQSFEPGVED